MECSAGALEGDTHHADGFRVELARLQIELDRHGRLRVPCLELGDRSIVLVLFQCPCRLLRDGEPAAWSPRRTFLSVSMSGTTRATASCSTLPEWMISKQP